jgi:AcrR family transcriptional regulator
MVAAALELAATSGWSTLTMADIARHAGISLLDAFEALPDKLHLIDALMTEVDRDMLAAGAADPTESARDRLFDVIMRRFDALAPYRHGVARLVGDLPRDPAMLAVMVPHLLRSMAWVQEAAGLPSSGPFGRLRVPALAAIYLSAFRVWLEDDTTDMARTMAVLDRGLRRAETAVRAFPPLAAVAEPPAEPTAAGPEGASPPPD